MKRIGLVHLLLLTAIATPALAQDSRRRDDGRVVDAKQSARIDTTVAFASGGTISLTVTNGDILVTPSPRSEVHIRSRSDHGHAQLNVSPGRLSLDLSTGGGNDARLEVMVPVGVHLIAHALNGNVKIQGTAGDVDARTQTGDIHVDGASGHIELGSLSGDVEGADLKGDVSVEVTSGDIRLTRVTGDLRAETVSGGVTLRDITSRNVRAHSTASDVSFDGAIDPSGRYELASHASDVSITIPANTSAQIAVSTWTGSVKSDFPITLAPGERRKGGGQSTQFTFAVGTGTGARISLDSFSGDITIHRRSK